MVPSGCTALGEKRIVVSQINFTVGQLQHIEKNCKKGFWPKKTTSMMSETNGTKAF